ncbi:GNAT family N-acetyltransferase [Streptomyces sp. TRM 70361]|uniref:GNAT family N-acetyltransferase n=1 Tax=Streptomyces sp. TRM 70361 TaxID=3116553 RepID=UPI002E7BF138|nr:GNAT family N-acetyltransferase [Streptomyces sp. TRM 70361]MEE1939080.1 GNAT family N-acetyltransferase [Streptomyces sp. TRM 70361]
MTTTLRPTAPERRTADGARRRPYDICVNGRPVGEVLLATDERSGPATGRLENLTVHEPDRRRGRATVAALAAEEVLRGWGCSRVEAGVPASAGPALRLAAALGYTERSRGMVKDLPPSPPAADGVLRPMTAAEYPAWLETCRTEYVRLWIAEGVPPERAERGVGRQYAALLPDGPETAGVALRVLVHGGADVGTLWLGPSPVPECEGWVYRVEVAAGHRGRGHGRTLMRGAERECAAAGWRTLGLNVFTDNVPALRLYESLGYRPAVHHLRKPLL